MIGVWCTDGPLYKDSKDNYYSLTINEKIINRYLEYVDKLYILTRVRKLDNKITQSNIINNKQINIIEVPNCSSIKQLILNKNIAKNVISKYIKLADISIIGLPSILGNIAIEVCQKYKKEYIVEVLGCAWDALWNHRRISGKFFAPIQYFITKDKIKKSNNVIYVSNEFLQKRYPNNKNSIGCSDVIINEYSEDVLDRRIQKINSQHKIYKLGLIGSLDLGYKGHKTAIKAIKLLKDKYKIELHFLGKGSPDYLKKEIRKNKVEKFVKFDGSLPSGNPVYKWMDDIDIFLIPSLQEGLPRALVEAMSRGCPAVGTNTGGIPELLEKDFIVRKKDYKAFAMMIENLIKNKHLMISQAERNFRKAAEYQKDTLYKIRRDYYLSIIRGIEK